MSDVGEVLDRIEELLRQAIVAGAAHAPDALDELFALGEHLDVLGLDALAGPLYALKDAQTVDELVEGLADIHRLASLARLLLIGFQAPAEPVMAAWNRGGLHVVPARSIRSALTQPSELRWSLALEAAGELSEDMSALYEQACSGNTLTIRRRAAAALGRIPTPDSRRALVALLGQVGLRRAVRLALLNHGPGSVPDLMSAVDDSDPGTFHRIVQLLYDFGAGPELAALAESGKATPLVRCYAALANDGAFDTDPPQPGNPYSAAAQAIYRAHSGEAPDELTNQVLALGKPGIEMTAALLADTLPGDLLLARARDLMTGRSASPQREHGCLLLGNLGTLRDVSLLICAAQAGLAQAFKGLSLLGGEDAYRFLKGVLTETTHLSGHKWLAIQALGDLRDGRAVPFLLPYVHDNQCDSYAATALGKIGDPQAVEPICERLQTIQQRKVDALVDALIALDDAQAVDGILAFLRRSSGRAGSVEKPLVRGLVHFGEAAADRVAALFDEPDMSLHAIAEDVLRGIDAEHSRALLETYRAGNPLKRLLARLAFSSPIAYQQARQELDTKSGAELAALVREAVQDAEANQKTIGALLRAVEHRKEPELLAALDEIVDTARTPVAQIALSALAKFPYVVSRGRLKARLLTGTPEIAQRAAQHLLSQDRSASSAVLDLLAHPEPAARANAVTVLGNQHARWTVDKVLPLLEDPDEQVREAALGVLPRLSLPRVEPVIIDKLVEHFSEYLAHSPGHLINAVNAIATGTARRDLTARLTAAWHSHRQDRMGGRILEIIGAVGCADARPFLEQQLQNSAFQQSALTALSYLGDPSVIPVLEQLPSRASNVQVLQRIGDSVRGLERGDYLVIRAQVAMTRGNYRAAYEDIDRYIAANPENERGHFERARVQHASGYLQEAYDDYVCTAALSPRHVSAYTGAALTAHALDDMDAAIQHYDKALTIRRDEGLLKFCRGLVHLRRGNYTAAQSDFRAASTDERHLNEVSRRIAWAIAEIIPRLPGQAVLQPDDLLVHLVQPISDPIHKLALCWLYCALGRPEYALRCIERKMDEWPDARAGDWLLVWWLNTALGHDEQAAHALDQMQVELAALDLPWRDYVYYSLAGWPVAFPLLIPEASAHMAGLMQESFRQKEICRE